VGSRTAKSSIYANGRIQELPKGERFAVSVEYTPINCPLQYYSFARENVCSEVDNFSWYTHRKQQKRSPLKSKSFKIQTFVYLYVSKKLFALSKIMKVIFSMRLKSRKNALGILYATLVCVKNDDE
jgi:hypothetical protein